MAGGATAGVLPPPPARLLAQELLRVELLNAGWKAWRAGAISEEPFEGIAELAPRLFSELVPAAALLPAAQRWSRRLDHPAYDGLYLALAEDRMGLLITQDQRLLSRLRRDPRPLGWRWTSPTSELTMGMRRLSLDRQPRLGTAAPPGWPGRWRRRMR